ncbi:hypothetical protein CMUS01_02325 [Colletotrichum musicola]|uniref:Uncharacterized protein n=1 Tax=Colletotrichum musicola TaxID=2175873 RepID=A0A8H6NVB0_9PEZI|nr:hypothetical protein CMUS01_02325 [Colletotrichum musicola]
MPGSGQGPKLRNDKGLLNKPSAEARPLERNPASSHDALATSQYSAGYTTGGSGSIVPRQTEEAVDWTVGLSLILLRGSTGEAQSALPSGLLEVAEKLTAPCSGVAHPPADFWEHGLAWARNSPGECAVVDTEGRVAGP